MSNRLFVNKGDTARFSFDPVDIDEEPIDASLLSDIQFILRRSKQDTLHGAAFLGTLADGAITVAEESVELTIPADVTDDLRTGVLYFWELKFLSGDDTHTSQQGSLVVLQAP